MHFRRNRRTSVGNDTVANDCYESYTMMPDRKSLLVRSNGGRYFALLVDRELRSSARLEIPSASSIVTATTKALAELGINDNVTTILFKDSLVDREDVETMGAVEVDDDLMDTVRTVSTDAIRKLIDDDSIDDQTRAAMKLVLDERRDS